MIVFLLMRANVVFRSIQCTKMSQRVASCSYTMERLLLGTQSGVCSRSEVSVVPEGFLNSSGECWKTGHDRNFPMCLMKCDISDAITP